MTNSTLLLQPLWINHIERFPERMRPRLYGALIAFLLHGTPIPEKLLPYLGIIVDLMELEGICPAVSTETPASTCTNAPGAEVSGADSAPGLPVNELQEPISEKISETSTAESSSHKTEISQAEPVRTMRLCQSEVCPPRLRPSRYLT
ncbi:MAG: hypothetical protein K2M19_03035 [Muribaculaceae bacterium]|nr:hypothetical protein [Muribaculaceae bacterium]